MTYRTPEQIQAFVNTNMYRMDAGFQWLGDEPNTYRKDWDTAALRAVIFACWPYEQSSGNQAIPLVYRTINEGREDFLCDRSYFYATPRDMRIFTSKGYPQFGIEQKHQLLDYDIVGTSISYPMLTINFIKQLLISDIPSTWVERQVEPEKWPFVIVGGQIYGAPELVGTVVDAVWCGEVEDEENNPGLAAVCERITVFKVQGRWSTERMSCYADLAREFNFLYFPCFIDVHYGYEERESVAAAVETYYGPDEPVHPSKQVIGYTSRLPGMRVPIVKRIVKDLDAVEGLTNPPLLYNNPSMGAGDAEVGRGCPAWCSFCALTYRQKPYRQRSPEYMVNFGKELIKNTGGLHIAPFSPDFPMHTQKKRLIRDLLAEVTDEVDASSMRVDDFIADPSYILLQAHGGMDTVTLGLEGNSQRMRDLVGKGASDASVKEAVVRGIQAGIRKFKLYMIASLPGEDRGDIYHILALGRELADIRDSMGSTARIQFSWTPMLMEGNTPFQWFAPTSANYALGDVWEEFRDLHIDFKLGSKGTKDKLGYFQLTQRASREVGTAMVAAVNEFNEGCWGGAPRGLRDRLDAQLRAHGFLNGFADCFDERTKQDMFGWEHIDQGINIELLWTTYQQMMEFLENTDSETYDHQFSDDYQGNEWVQRCDTACLGKSCGVCDAEDLKIRRGYIQGAVNEAQIDLANVKVIDERSVAQKVRCRVVKGSAKRFVMNNHFRYAMRRAANRVGLIHAKRTWNFATDALKFKDWTCGVDYVEFGITKRMTRAQLSPLIDAMNVELRGDLTGEDVPIQITDWGIFTSNSVLRTDVDLSLFDMELDESLENTQLALDRWADADYIKMIFKEESFTGVQTTEVNGKDYVEAMWLVREGHTLRIRMLVRGKASPYIVYAALFGRRSWLEAAKRPATRLEAFVEYDDQQIDSFRPSCVECSRAIPVNLLDVPWDSDYCPRCADVAAGVIADTPSVR